MLDMLLQCSQGHTYRKCKETHQYLYSKKKYIWWSCPSQTSYYSEHYSVKAQLIMIHDCIPIRMLLKVNMVIKSFHLKMTIHVFAIHSYVHLFLQKHRHYSSKFTSTHPRAFVGLFSTQVFISGAFFAPTPFLLAHPHY